MAKKLKVKEPSIFRIIFLCANGKSNYHLDFTSKDDAIQHANDLNDSSVEWYGIYELDPLCDSMKRISSKRLIPYNNIIEIESEHISKKSNRVRKRLSNV